MTETKELYTIPEAAKVLGLSGDSGLRRREAKGDFSFIVATVDGKPRKMVTAEDLERLKALVHPYGPHVNGKRGHKPHGKRTAGYKPQASTPKSPRKKRPQERDELLDALDAMADLLRGLRKLIRDHDDRVRRETIRSIADSLKEGASK